MNLSRTLMDSLSNLDSNDVKEVLSKIDMNDVQETLSKVNMKELLESLSEVGGKELLTQLTQCKSAQDIMALTKQFGKELMKDEAETLFAQFKESRKDAGDMFGNVASGLGGILNFMSNQKD